MPPALAPPPAKKLAANQTEEGLANTLAFILVLLASVQMLVFVNSILIPPPLPLPLPPRSPS